MCHATKSGSRSHFSLVANLWDSEELRFSGQPSPSFRKYFYFYFIFIYTQVLICGCSWGYDVPAGTLESKVCGGAAKLVGGILRNNILEGAESRLENNEPER